MGIQKITLGEIPRCYCTGHVTIDGNLYALLASEAEGGACYAYTGADFSKRETVWENAGGTMSMVEIPRSNGQFLAVQNFFPGFQAKDAKIVHCKRASDGTWTTKDVLHLPYVHRFDILERDGVLYFLGAVLCGSKKERNDWSDPGRVVVGVLPESFDHGETIAVTPLLEGLTKNHGYWRDETTGVQTAYVTSENGIFTVTPPEKHGGHWCISHVLNRPVSDVAVVDLDGCGVPELLSIEPFHGSKLHLWKKNQGDWKLVYDYDHPMDFAHALWGGTLLGRPAAIVGIRRMDCELFILEHHKGRFVVNLIEKGVGTANVDVVHQQNREILIAANHTKNEAAFYLLTP